jgi:hypothetical protein
MIRTIIWALVTGAVVGAVWTAIFLLRRRPGLLPPPSGTDPLEAMDEFDVLHDRLEVLEERLDQSEYERVRDRLRSGDAPGPGPRP